VGASSEKFEPSVEDLPSTFEHIEGEVEVLDEVIAGHGDFCALLASRSTAVAFMKAGCMSHPALRNKARCISYMRQEDNIYNNRVYRDKCHKTSEYLLHSGRLITK
jgi:hypothetical protein